MKKRAVVLDPARYVVFLFLAGSLNLFPLTMVCAQPNWQAQGPSPIEKSNGVTNISPNNPVYGAIQVVLPHPKESRIIYVGTVNGGIWRTINGGTNWKPLTDSQNSLSIGAMAFDASDPKNLVAGYGVFSNYRGVGGPRLGLISSNDGGDSWSPIGSPFLNNTEISALLCNKKTIWAASRDPLDSNKSSSEDTNLGLFLSFDGGRSFQLVSGTGGLPTGGVTSVAWDSRDYNKVYAAVTKNGIFCSSNGGKTWTKISIPGMNIGSQTRNILLSVGAGGQSLFVAIARTYPDPPNEKGAKERLESVWRSLNGGATWQNLGGQGSGASKGLPGSTEDTGFFGVNPGGQADINLSLLADPTNPNVVYIGGDAQPAKNEGKPGEDPKFPNSIGADGFTGRLFRGDASKPVGQQWTSITDNYSNPKSGPHADSRWQAIDAQGNLLQVDDGGIYRQTSPASNKGSWQSLNGNLQITEFYSHAVSYDRNTKTIIGGSQDNGVAEQKTSGGTAWVEVEGWSGDGGITAVNDASPNFSVRYGSAQKLTNFGRYKVDTTNKRIGEQIPTKLVVEGTGGKELKDVDTIPFITEVVLNQYDKTMIAFGTKLVYLTKDEVTQEGALSESLTLKKITPQELPDVVSAMAYGRPNNIDLSALTVSVDAGKKQFSRASDSWIKDGVRSGDFITIAGFKDAGNNGTFKVTAVSDLAVTCADAKALVKADNHSGVAVTNGNKNLLLVGTDKSLYLSTTLAPGSLTMLKGSPGAEITSLCINVNSDDRFYVADDAAIYSTDNRGDNWDKRISLSQIRAIQFVNRIVDSKDRSKDIYAVLAGGYGTLYAARDNNLDNWYSLKGALPNTSISSLDYSRQDDVLVVGTTGRGAFTLANASTFMPVAPGAADPVTTGWLRLLRAGTGNQTLNGGTLQTPAVLTWGKNLTLDTGGGTLDTAGNDSTLSGVISGAGSFTKAGGGTLFLTGTNTYRGGTILTAGTLNVKTDGNLGAASGGFTFNGGALEAGANFASSRAVTLNDFGGTFHTGASNYTSSLSGAISGVGTLQMNGTNGTLNLQGTNTYTGGTILTGGTLNITNDNNLGAADGTLTFNGGTLKTGAALTSSRIIALQTKGGTVDTYGYVSTWNGLLFGAQGGTLKQRDSSAGNNGSLTYSGDGSAFAGTYDLGGGTFTQSNTLGSSLSPCTIQVGSGASDSGIYNLSGGKLTANTCIIGDSGQGTFTQTNGVNTVSTMTVARKSGSSGIYNLSGGALTVNNCVIGDSGQGTFTQTAGSNTVSIMTMALNSGGNGVYRLDGGSLTVKSLTVKNGGTFNKKSPDSILKYENFTLDGSFFGELDNTSTIDGSGTINGKLINQGTADPGQSPGTLNVAGSYIQTATGIYTVEIASPSAYDIIEITGAPGTATLAGTIAPTAYGGFQPRGNQVFPGILTATGGVAGTFNTIENQQFTPTLFWQTRYNPTSVDLWVQRDYTNPGLGLNTNQQAVGAALNSVAGVSGGDLNHVLNTIDYLPSAAAVREAFREISPEKSAALSNLALTGASFQMRHQAQRLTDLRFVSREAGLGSDLAGINPMCSSQFNGLMLAFNSPSMSGLITREQPAASANPWGLYLYPSVILGNQQSTANQTGYTFTMASFTLGADYRLRDNLLVGLATGYSYTNADFKGSGGGVQNNTWPLTVYAAYLEQSFYTYGSLGYTLNLIDQQRSIQFGGLKRTADSSPTGNQLNVYAEAGYDLKPKPFIITPVVSLAYSGLWLNGYSETGAGALNLDVASQNATSLQTGVGLKVAAPFKTARGTVIPQVYATYQHEFANNSRGLDASLSQGGSTFTFTTDAPQRDFALVGAKVDLLTSKNFQISLNYNAEVGRSNSFAQSIYTGVRWQF
jgi:autotransporter-associated beta strand protein